MVDDGAATGCDAVSTIGQTTGVQAACTGATDRAPVFDVGYAVDIHAVTITVVDGLSVTELVVHMTGADIVAADEAAVEDDTMAIEADTGAVLAGDDTVGLVDDDGVGDADAVCDGVIHGGAVESDAVGVDVGNQLFCADQVGICSFADWVTAIN